MKFGTLQVYPRQGLLVEHGLDLPSALIGRGEGSNIHIDDFSISRRHARLTVDSGRLLVEDLGSVGGTFVDGERLEPGVRHLVEDSAVLRFGEIEARYLPPETVDATLVALDANTEVVSAGGLSIALVSPETPVEAGRTTTATLVVTNRGRIVDNVRVEVPDLPADWYSVDTPAFPILPGGRADVKVSIHPPRRHDSLAGGYTFTVAVRSQEYDEHPETQGSFHVLPFESATISLEAIRSKRDFRLLAENRGNDVARYELFGSDDEQAFQYGFESPAIELQPGEKRIINLSVRRPRQLFGAAQQPPFTIVGKSSSGAEISANGQLAVRPPLQKFRMPVLFSLAALVLAVTAMAVLIVTDGDGTNTANAEDPYAGVHLCTDDKAKDDQAKKNAAAANDKPLTGATVVGPYDGGRPVFGEVDKNGAPFFAQSDARWATQEYARSTELPNGKDWCGTTIEQCGCAMTSVSVMLALYDILQMPGGEPLSPKALNDWFNGAARQTDRGWVSRGYIYGDVIWSAANELSAEIARVKPGSRTVRFVRTGSGSEDDIRAELNAGRPVILEVPGHWIAAVGLDNDGAILINDPFYRDRKTLDVYKGKVRSSVHYEPSSDLSSVVITAPADVKFKITDKQGRVVNTGTGTLDAPAESLNQIPGASVAARHAWRDPTCIESAPPTDAGTNQVVLPGSRDDYTIEIISAGDQGGALAIHTYGRDGASSIATIEGGEGTKAEIAFDPNADKPVINVSTNGTPQATSTPQPGDGGAGGDTETPTPRPAPSASPAPTSTPFVEQRTAMTLSAEPGQTRVEVATNSGFELGDPIRFAPGLPNEEDNIIVGFGSFILATPLKFAHGPGEPIARLQRPPGQGPGLPPGITPPPSTGPLEPPKEVTMACSTLYQPSPKQATLICDLTVNGTFTTTRWTLNGKVVSEFSGSPSLIMTFPGDTPASVSATVCNVTLCRSTSRNEQVLFPATGTGGSGTGGTGTGGTGTPVVPTPPAGTVTVTCGTAFDQAKTPAVANITCQANFSGEFTSISWSAPGGKPANASGAKKTFETQLVNDLGAPTTVKITATVCNFGTCRTSQPLTVGIGQTKTIVDADPAGGVPQRHSVTLFAIVTGLNGIVPQGGSVQFIADDIPINPSAALITVGSLSVAQVSVQTGGTSGLSTVGTHTVKAVYSGGLNAFGSESLVRDFEVLPPIPDGCDSVDEDANGDTDETCSFALPKNLGGGTVVNSVSISGGLTDGAPNAVVASPGQPLTITGTVGRTDYCPGCLRQLYIGIGPNTTTGTPGVGPQCNYSGGMLQIPAALAFAPTSFTAPTVPGVYYLRATTTLDYFCVGPGVGPPDKSIGRIVVRDSIKPVVDAFANTADALPTSPWDNVLSAPTTKAAAGEQLLIRARVPAGATGAIDIRGFKNAAGNDVAVVALVCPPGGVVPSGTFRGSACTPGEARVLSPALLDDYPVLSITAEYRNDAPLRLLDPAFGFTAPTTVVNYPVYLASSPSDPYGLSVLVAATVSISAAPNPVRMGDQFTLTATVTSANASLNLFGTGGSVQFMAGTNLIGAAQTVTNTDGTVSINWTPRNCDNYDTNPANNCSTANEGFPFDTRDDNDRGYYDNVHAVFTTGTSDLKGATSADINVDINPATSTTTMTVSPTTVAVGGTVSLEAVVSASGGFTPSGGSVQFKFRKASESASSAANLGPLVPLALDSGTWKASIPSLSTGADGDAIHEAANYVITAEFQGTSQVGISASGDTPLTVTKAAPALTVTLPGSGTVTVGDTGNIRAVVSGSPSNRLDDSPARLKFFDGATELASLTVSNLGSGVLGADFSVSSLNAGAYSITVEYVANAYFTGTTSSAQTLTVNKYSPSITVNTITAVQVGNDLTISSTLQCGGGACSSVRDHAGGSVSFYKDSVSATNLLATDTSISAGGTASITVSTGDTLLLPAAGTAYSIVAAFNGDATNGNLNAVTSAAATVTLTKRTPAVTVPNQSQPIGTTITLTATVTSGSASVSPDCSACVQFKVGALQSSAVAIGTPQNVASGTANLTGVTTGGGTGTFGSSGGYVIWAEYTANTNLNAASDSGNLTLAQPVDLTVSAPAIVQVNTAATLSAAVSPASAPGTVQFKVNGTNHGSPQTLSSGAASISWTPTASGSYSITATYNSSSTTYLDDDTSNAATVAVPAAVTLTLTGGGQTGDIGSSLNMPVTISPAGAAGTLKLYAKLGTNPRVEVDSETHDGTGSQTLDWASPANAGTYTSVDFVPDNAALFRRHIQHADEHHLQDPGLDHGHHIGGHHCTGWWSGHVDSDGKPGGCAGDHPVRGQRLQLRGRPGAAERLGFYLMDTEFDGGLTLRDQCELHLDGQQLREQHGCEYGGRHGHRSGDDAGRHGLPARFKCHADSGHHIEFRCPERHRRWDRDMDDFGCGHLHRTWSRDRREWFGNAHRGDLPGRHVSDHGNLYQSRGNCAVSVQLTN
ncbi:Ig-like domain repeat protein [Candidatus Amarobacter glycogenicus]|uniref:Ig-like domain repeat protein n=1 Tax=Candidatus Amarobacter glycogenicus TaxID=3140699 RepID=UPI0031CCD18A